MKELNIQNPEQIYKTIELLVVSLNDIAMASVDDRVDLASEIVNFIQSRGILDELAEARYNLSAGFSDEEINHICKSVNYWRPEHKGR